MFEQLNTYLSEFSVCFSRTAAYYWFVTIVVGFIVRRDVRGITSIIRCLNLCPSLYESLLSFFRASSWSIEKLWAVWAKVICQFCSVVTLNDHIILVGDSIKVAKEANKMPAVKKLHQESENSGKAKYIFGHHFGFIGMLAGNLKKYFCIPVAAKIHEGVEDISKFKGEETDDKYNLSVVTRMLMMAKQISGYLSKSCILVLDAYYATGPAFMIASQSIDNLGNQLLHIITRAKNNTVAYEDPKLTPGKRGRPAVRGKKIVLSELFVKQADMFCPLSIDIYGKETSLSYLCLDLIWRPIMKKVRFVLVKNGSTTCIFMTSKLDLLPQDIIQLYSYRFKIEIAFKELKHRIGSFFYHFWTQAMPKLDKKTPIDLKTVTNEHQQQLIVKTTKAIEGFVNIGCISIGLLQMLSINFSKNVWSKYTGWLRTRRSDTPSEETVRAVLEQEYYFNFCNFSKTATFKIITAKQRKKANLYDENYDDEVV